MGDLKSAISYEKISYFDPITHIVCNFAVFQKRQYESKTLNCNINTDLYRAPKIGSSGVKVSIRYSYYIQEDTLE
jgi:hypothetical protein